MGRRLVLRGELLQDKRERKKEAYLPAGTSLQVFLYRSNYSCEGKPAEKCL
jgi:hypothetical protein